MTYYEALRYLNSSINYERRARYDYAASFRLERMHRLASALGDPQKSIRALHIAGSKGKGSTATFIYSILRAAGFSVGLYTSPHLVSVTERIRIDDHLIPEEDFGRLMGRVKEAVRQMAVDWPEEDQPSFFEILTAIAFLYFKERRADFAIYEVGLGGRLDATNIVEPLACAITPISYEHTDILGSTLAEIAEEKAGIIKEGILCVSAPQGKEALDAIEAVAAERRARLVLIGRDIFFEELASDEHGEAFSVFGRFGEYPMLKTSLLGLHQALNAATAIGLAEALRPKGILIPPSAVADGIAAARWPCRIEVVSRSPAIVLDGAHNRASAAALAVAVKKIFKYRRLILVLGVSKDKDIAGILDELLPMSDVLIATRSNIPERALDPQRIAELAGRSRCRVEVVPDAQSAIEAAKKVAKEADLILATGSLFLVGEIRDIIFKKEPCPI